MLSIEHNEYHFQYWKKRTMLILRRHMTVASSKQGMIQAIITQIINVLMILLQQESFHIFDNAHKHFFKDYGYDL